MHEMSIALNIIDIVSSQAKAEQAQKINRIELEIGELAGILIDSLEFCFEAASKNTLADSASLNIVKIPGKGICHDCHTEIDVDNYIVVCPNCGGFGVEITQGKELKIRSINID